MPTVKEMNKFASSRENEDENNIKDLSKPGAAVAKIGIMVRKFHEISEVHTGTPPVDIEMRATRNPILAVAQEKGSKPTLKLKVTGKGSVIVEFTIAARKGVTPGYFPIGIAYMRKGQSKGRYNKEDKIARKAFAETRTHLFGHKLYVTYNYDTAKNDRFEFLVIIQNGRNGEVGVIDPGIGNPIHPGA